MATFSDYVRRKVPFLGGTVELDIRALSVTEAPAFVSAARALQERWVSDSERRKDEKDEDYEPRLKALFADLDAHVLGVMGKTISTKKGEKGYYVRLAEPLVNDDDETAIEDCRTLGERGGRMFRMAVMAEISSLAEVDPFLGFSSGSPSTSTSAAGQPTSEVPVSSTAGCVLSSTATSTSLELVPSSPAA
jgi:hypothetical protein